MVKSKLERLSRHRSLRVIPLLRLHYHRNDSPEALVRFHQRINEIRYRLFFWRFAPAKYRGGLLLNLLGFQVLRYLYFNLRYALRGGARSEALPPAAVYEMRRNGFTLRPGALSQADITPLLAFYNRHRARCMNHFEDFSELLIANSRGPVDVSEDYRAIYELTRKATRWDDLGRALTRRSMAINPYVAILHYKSSASRPQQQDGQDTPHCDVFYPSFKAFFYLNDVDAAGGPLTFYTGSQAFGWRRALQEYIDSVRYFAGARNDTKPISNQEYAERGGYPATPLTGTAGTAVLFNVQGIHRRGDFRKDRDRERIVLLIDFRQAEVALRRFAA